MNDLLNLATCVWLTAGLAAGWLHATLLWHAARRPTAWTAALGLLRLVAVATVLVAAGLYAQIIVAAAGWAVGFASLGVWLTRRANPTVGSSQVFFGK